MKEFLPLPAIQWEPMLAACSSGTKKRETNNRGTRVFGARVALSKQLVDLVSKWGHRY